MSRKFNTKKFLKDVLNNKYALVIGNENILDPKNRADKRRSSILFAYGERKFQCGI